MAFNPDRELIEQALPGYEIGLELGRGAWGVVLGGRHRRLDRLVAIKQLPRAFAADAEVSERFLHEARMAASLEHPHIVPVYDYVEQDGLALIVMELCPNTVAAKFHTEGIHTDEACAAILATCSALSYAHGRSVLHRDIKPENLLVADDGVVKLADFGIARALDAATRLTATGTILGTPAYMSPEQAGGEDLGPHSDVYSTGVVLYELLTGDLPFEETGSVGALMRQHLFEPPRPLLSVKPDVPQRIAAAVDRSLEKDQSVRYATASDFGVALAEATAHAFGAGWLRQRRFSLLGAPEIVAAAEKDVGGAGRGGTIVVRGHAREVVAPPIDELDGSAGEPSAPGSATMASGADPVTAGSATIDPTGPPSGAPPTTERDVSSLPPPAPPAFLPAPPHSAPAADPEPEPVVPLAAASTSGAGTRMWLVIGGIAAGLVALFVVVFVLAGGGGDGDPAESAGGETGDDAVTTPGGADTGTDGTGADPDDGDTTDPAPGDGQPDAGGTDAEAPPGADSPGPLILGTLIDDGDFSTDDDQAVAIDLAVEDIDAAGGVLGQPLRLLKGTYADAAGLGIIAADHMEGGASALIGPSDPVDTNGILSTVTGSGVILVSPTDWFSRPDDSGLYFQTRVPRPLVGIGGVLLLPDGADTVAMIVDGDTQSTTDITTQMVIAQRIQDRGFTPVRIDVVGGDFAAAAAEVAAAPPDAVLIYGITVLTDLYRALIDAGVGPTVLPYVVAGNDGGALDMDGGQITGVVGIVRDFLTGNVLEERVPASDFTSDAAQAYDAVIILALAAEAATSVAPADIAAQISAVTGGGEECTTYQACIARLAEGGDIDYVGPGGPYEISASTGEPTAGYYRVGTVGESGFSLGIADQVVVRGQGELTWI